MCSCFHYCPPIPGRGPHRETLSQEEVTPLRRLPTPLPTDLIRGTIKHGLTVEDLIMTGVNYLDRRSDFWRQQKPIYARERDRKLMQEKRLGDRKRRPSQAARYILKSLEDIDMCGWCSQKGGPVARWGQSRTAAGAPGFAGLWMESGGGSGLPCHPGGGRAAPRSISPLSLPSADQRQC